MKISVSIEIPDEDKVKLREAQSDILNGLDQLKEAFRNVKWKIDVTP